MRSVLRILRISRSTVFSGMPVRFARHVAQRAAPLARTAVIRPQFSASPAASAIMRLRRALLEALARARTEFGSRRGTGHGVRRTRPARIIPTSFSVRRGQAGDQFHSLARRAPLVPTIESGALQMAHGDVDVLAVE